MAAGQPAPGAPCVAGPSSAQPRSPARPQRTRPGAAAPGEARPAAGPARRAGRAQQVGEPLRVEAALVEHPVGERDTQHGRRPRGRPDPPATRTRCVTLGHPAAPEISCRSLHRQQGAAVVPISRSDRPESCDPRWLTDHRPGGNRPGVVGQDRLSSPTCRSTDARYRPRPDRSPGACSAGRFWPTPYRSIRCTRCCSPIPGCPPGRSPPCSRCGRRSACWPRCRPARWPTGSAGAPRWSRPGCCRPPGTWSGSSWPTFIGFAAGFVVWGLGGALVSGAQEALLYDGLAAVGAEAHYARVNGWVQAAMWLSELPTAGAATLLYALGGYELVGWVSVGVVRGRGRCWPPGYRSRPATTRTTTSSATSRRCGPGRPRRRPVPRSGSPCWRWPWSAGSTRWRSTSR